MKVPLRKHGLTTYVCLLWSTYVSRHWYFMKTDSYVSRHWYFIKTEFIKQSYGSGKLLFFSFSLNLFGF